MTDGGHPANEGAGIRETLRRHLPLHRRSIGETESAATLERQADLLRRILTSAP